MVLLLPTSSLTRCTVVRRMFIPLSNAWRGQVMRLMPAAWMRRFQNLSGFVAVRDGVMVGFMTLDSDGYIDLAFVHSQHAGHGIGRLLYAEVELTCRGQRHCAAHNAGKHQGKAVLCPNGVAARYRAGRREAGYRAGQL